MSGNYGAVILAAGAASRFGKPKQLLEIDGVTLLDRACLLARVAGCRPVLRVLGAHADEIMKRPFPPGILTLLHESWEEGMGSSLAAGVRALLAARADLDGIFILLPDQPLASADLLEKMFAEVGGTTSIALCHHGKLLGPPAFFGWQHFPELLTLTGDRGAKSIATKQPQALATVAFPGLALDIDTPEAWEEFSSANSRNPPPCDEAP